MLSERTGKKDEPQQEQFVEHRKNMLEGMFLLAGIKFSSKSKRSLYEVVHTTLKNLHVLYNFVQGKNKS